MSHRQNRLMDDRKIDRAGQADRLIEARLRRANARTAGSGSQIGVKHQAGRSGSRGR